MTVCFVRFRSCVHAAALGALVLAAAIFPKPAKAQGSETTVAWSTGSLRPTDTWNTLTLEMAVSRRRVDKTGAAIGTPSPNARYRIERSSRTGSWKTVIAVMSVDRSPSYSLTGALRQPEPFPVARIEDDEDGTPVRAYDRDGNPIHFSPAGTWGGTTFARSTGREWLETFVASTAGRTSRLQKFERHFGTPTNWWGLSRYRRSDGDKTDELLVEPTAAVPFQKNGMRNGRLLAHRTFSYGAAPDGAVVRTAVHSETLLSEVSEERAIVNTTFSNIRLELKR